jgi:hypothetical protein
LPWCLAMTSARSGGVSLDRSRAEASVTVFKFGRVDPQFLQRPLPSRVA